MSLATYQNLHIITEDGEISICDCDGNIKKKFKVLQLFIDSLNCKAKLVSKDKSGESIEMSTSVSAGIIMKDGYIITLSNKYSNYNIHIEKNGMFPVSIVVHTQETSNIKSYKEIFLSNLPFVELKGFHTFSVKCSEFEEVKLVIVPMVSSSFAKKDIYLKFREDGKLYKVLIARYNKNMFPPYELEKDFNDLKWDI